MAEQRKREAGGGEPHGRERGGDAPGREAGGAAQRPLEESVGYELGRAFRRLSRAVSAALRPHGLSAAHANILLALWAHGPMTVGALQELLDFSSSAFSGALDRMEKAELVRRVPSPTDRRSFLVEPIPFSRARRSSVIEALGAAEDAFLAGIDAGERAQLLALLRRIGDPSS